jgi:hypothetical protein
MSNLPLPIPFRCCPLTPFMCLSPLLSSSSRPWPFSLFFSSGQQFPLLWRPAAVAPPVCFFGVLFPSSPIRLIHCGGAPPPREECVQCYPPQARTLAAMEKRERIDEDGRTTGGCGAMGQQEEQTASAVSRKGRQDGHISQVACPAGQKDETELQLKD